MSVCDSDSERQHCGYGLKLLEVQEDEHPMLLALYVFSVRRIAGRLKAALMGIVMLYGLKPIASVRLALRSMLLASASSR